MPRFSRLGWRALVALALLASSVSAQTVIETQGSEVDWQFAFIVSACLAGFLFIIVVVQFIYIRISIRKHKELRTRQRFQESAPPNRSTDTSLPPSRQFGGDARVLSSSNFYASTSGRSRMSSAAPPREAWQDRVDAMNKLEDSSADKDNQGEDFTEFLEERLGTVSTDNPGADAHRNSPSRSTVRTETPEGATVDDYDFGDDMHMHSTTQADVHMHDALHADDDDDDIDGLDYDAVDWPKRDSDNESEAQAHYDIADGNAASRLRVRLLSGATDTRVEEVDLNMPDAYMDVQGVSRSHNSTAHSAGAKSPVETRVDDDEDDDNDV